MALDKSIRKLLGWNAAAFQTIMNELWDSPNPRLKYIADVARHGWIHNYNMDKLADALAKFKFEEGRSEARLLTEGEAEDLGKKLDLIELDKIFNTPDLPEGWYERKFGKL